MQDVLLYSFDFQVSHWLNYICSFLLIVGTKLPRSLGIKEQTGDILDST